MAAGPGVARIGAERRPKRKSIRKRTPWDGPAVALLLPPPPPTFLRPSGFQPQRKGSRLENRSRWKQNCVWQRRGRATVVDAGRQADWWLSSKNQEDQQNGFAGFEPPGPLLMVANATVLAVRASAF